MDGPAWPYAGHDLLGPAVRRRRRDSGRAGDVFANRRIGRMDGYTTVENGQPIQLSHTSFDGEVTVSAPSTWRMWWPEAAHVADVGVWFGGLCVASDSSVDGERVEFVDPVACDAVRSERRVSAALGAGRCSGNRAAGHRRSQLRDDSAGGRARRWPRRRVDRRRPCPWRRGLRRRND